MDITRDEIITSLRKSVAGLDVSGSGFMAVQINLKDVEPSVFYVEVKNGAINIEPYEYNDRNCAITIGSADFQKLVAGKLDPVVAYTLGKLKVEGDIGKALEFAKLVRK